MRIWFNHWFSTAYHLINLIKEEEPKKFTVIGSSQNPYAIYKQACDEWYIEEKGLSAEEYIDFCMEFCREHNIDIFVPRRYLTDIVKNADKFERMGVKLFADTSYEKMQILDDKFLTYEFFQKYIPECIPQIRVAHNIEEFDSAYNELQKISERVCYKLVIDEGARSFRIIDNRMGDAGTLLEPPGMKVTLESAKKVLAEYDFSIPVLLMPYLSGVEISVDCLATETGYIMVPRYKANGRYAEVIFDERVLEKCSKVMKALQLKMPLNIQFRMEKEKLYLLEINPRMSGGLQLSCMAAGVNIQGIAIKQLLGIRKEWEISALYSKKVAHIESPIIVE